ncbi:hypothetical protein CXB51_021158 [Gossypium anomalum]|uniref:2-carboxy-D-arabinitol-1-phosphatase n=1 Tax=Gossypium anomalum TaxID=47600 RepID=A0A8J5YJ72_9ROSI|nr:hypothetical protein CXB51_021158 [Gossypium anomalum]
MISLANTPLLLHGRDHHLPTKRRAPFTVRSSSSLQEVDKSPTTAEDSKLRSELCASVPFPPIKAAKRVVLVRHGQSTWNEEGRIQGSSNFSVLTKKGEAQAETSRQMLIDDSFDICFSSPLIRSKRTAEIIWGTREDEIITDSDLREIDLYSFQGLLKHEGKAKFGPAFRQWQVDAANFNIDGHYPVRELWGRARNCWTKILAHESKSVLVVAHNAVNQALVATAIGNSYIYLLRRVRGNVGSNWCRRNRRKRSVFTYVFTFVDVSGLGTEYFRILLQSNCGVSVLDFIPRPDGGSPLICLNRLNQTPGSPVATGSSAGRRTSRRIILVCQGSTQDSEATVSKLDDQQMNMLGVIQAQKTAELLLDLKLSTIISSPNNACAQTATIISQVQEAADCLGADCVPRYVEMKNIPDLDVAEIFQPSTKDTTDVSYLRPGWLNGLDDRVTSTLRERSGQAWHSLLTELSDESEEEKIVVAVAHPVAHIALIGHCLNLTEEWLGSFHLDAGSISVVDFPDGPTGRGIIRCINYTAHLGRWSIPITRSTVDDDSF